MRLCICIEWVVNAFLEYGLNVARVSPDTHSSQVTQVRRKSENCVCIHEITHGMHEHMKTYSRSEKFREGVAALLLPKYSLNLIRK